MNQRAKSALLCAVLWTFSALLTTITAIYSYSTGIVVSSYQMATTVLQYACAGLWWANFIQRNRKE